jgi:hypothetical protein
MGDTAGDPPDGLHLLRLPDSHLGLEPVCDVMDEDQFGEHAGPGDRLPEDFDFDRASVGPPVLHRQPGRE